MPPWFDGWVFTDRAGLPKDDYAELTARVPRARVLAWATGEDVLVVGTDGQLVVRQGGEWEVFPWHEVTSATWDESTGRLVWSSGRSRMVTLTSPGRVPALVKDRVEASLVLDDRHDAAGVPVVISARRDLTDPNGPLLWRVTGAGQAQLGRPAVQAAVEQRIAELKGELGR